MGLAGPESQKSATFQNWKISLREFLIELCKGTSENDVVQWLLAKEQQSYDGSGARSLIILSARSHL